LHYYLLIVPPLSLLAAWLIARLHNVGQTYDRTRLTALAMSVLLLLSIGTAYVYRNGGYLYHFIRYKIGQETYRAFVLNAWPPDGPTLVALQDIANYVEAHSAPDDRIYIWSDDVQLYYLANRRCALDFIWPILFGIACGAWWPGRNAASSIRANDKIYHRRSRQSPWLACARVGPKLQANRNHRWARNLSVGVR